MAEESVSNFSISRVHLDLWVKSFAIDVNSREARGLHIARVVTSPYNQKWIKTFRKYSVRAPRKTEFEPRFRDLEGTF